MTLTGSGRFARYGLATAMLAMAAGLAVATSPLHHSGPSSPAWDARDVIVVQVEQPYSGPAVSRPGEAPLSDARARAPRATAATTR